MFALVESGSIIKYLNGNKGIQIGDLKYPRAIYTLWTEAERNAIGIYEVVFDDTNKKDEKWYINTNQSYAFGSGKVTATYGTATAKAHADTTWTQEQIDDGMAPDGADTNTVATRGLKYNLIQTVKAQAASELARTDWYITRNAEKSTAIPSAITTHRDLVRSRQAAMETSITNASDTPALETLYTYVNTADEGDPIVMARPLAEIPTLE
jgi:hypothetical protein